MNILVTIEIEQKKVLPLITIITPGNVMKYLYCKLCFLKVADFPYLLTSFNKWAKLKEDLILGIYAYTNLSDDQNNICIYNAIS